MTAPHRTISKPPHPADGLTMRVERDPMPIGVVIPDPRSFKDGGLIWRLTYTNSGALNFCAAQVVETVQLLCSPGLSQSRAISILKGMRAAYKEALDE
jgi:hypothetical protein